MDPGTVPTCLESMTQIEEMLIALAYYVSKHGGQRGYVLNLPQTSKHTRVHKEIACSSAFLTNSKASWC